VDFLECTYGLHKDVGGSFKRSEKLNSLKICFRDGLLESEGDATDYFNAVANYSKVSTYSYTDYDRDKKVFVM